MAWKLKKWKGSDEEQESRQTIEQTNGVLAKGYSDSPPAQEPSVPGFSFSAAEAPPVAPPMPDEATPALALHPDELEGELAADHSPLEVPQQDFLPPLASETVEPLASAPLQDLDEPTQPSSEPEIASAATPSVASSSPDYFAQSASSAHEVEAIFEPAAAPAAEEDAQPATPAPADEAFDPIAPAHPEDDFDFDPIGPPPAAMPQAAAVPPPDAEAPAAASQAADVAQSPGPPAADEDGMSAFAPYKPAEAPAPEPDRFFAVDETASDIHEHVVTDPDLNGSGMHPQPVSLPETDQSEPLAPLTGSRLVVKIGPFAATYEINKAELTIGRPDVKTGTSPDIGLEWDDAVSRHHARILHKADGDYVEDVGSSNGTLYNGQLMAVDTPMKLANGDVVTIGERTQMTYLE